MCDTVRDMQRITHFTQVGNQQIHLFLITGAAQMHIVRNHTIALSGCFILCIEFDDLWQIHCICRTVNDVCALICEHCPCLCAME